MFQSDPLASIDTQNRFIIFKSNLDTIKWKIVKNDVVDQSWQYKYV